MVVFPYAKINVGLFVEQKRPDGFHAIRSLMWPIPLHDILELVPDPTLPSGTVVLQRSGLTVPGAPEDDLCVRAVRAVAGQQPHVGLRVHLHKLVPIGAGLGGGSSDAAHALRAADQLLGTAHGTTELQRMAAALGSDVPFFLAGGPCAVSGRGELLAPVPNLLKGTWVLLVNPGIHVPTAVAYAGCVPRQRDRGPEELLRAGELGLLENDLEAPVFAAYPAVRDLKERMIAHGAFHAAMSGSGSSVYGFFDREPEQLVLPGNHLQWCFTL